MLRYIKPTLYHTAIQQLAVIIFHKAVWL